MTVINAKNSVVSGRKKNRLAIKSITTPIPTKTVNGQLQGLGVDF